MPRHQCKNTINNIQENMPLWKSSELTIAGPKKCNLTAQDKDFTRAIVDKIEHIREFMNKFVN